MQLPSETDIPPWRSILGPVLGGLVGSVVLGQVFQRFGWEATVLAIGLALCAAAGLAVALGRDSGSRL